MRLTRRASLLGLATAVTLGRTSLALAGAATHQRFIVVLLRGALDGMAAVVPYGDPDLSRRRAELLLPPPGQPGGLLDMGGFWGLHPALPQLYALYQAGDLLPVHAVAGPDRSRSHFEAQDSMEIGAEQRMTSGWLNRVAGLLPAATVGETAVAFTPAAPLLLRGPTSVGTWVPTGPRNPSIDFYAQLAAMHSQDQLTGAAIADGLRERGFADSVLAGADPAPAQRSGLAQLAHTAGRLLAAPDGPRLAVLEANDAWDTHVGQTNQLPGALKRLDDGLAELKSGLGSAWSSSVVLVVTEFGRTVRVNGTNGTDHGTAGVAFVAGGGVAGGRVGGDWPGLAEAKLFEGRDVQPTTDLRGLVKGILVAQLGMDPAGLNTVFPGSASVPAMGAVLRG